MHEIQLGNHAIEVDLHVIIIIRIASTDPKWQTIKILRWIKKCTNQRETMEFCMMINLHRIYNF
jgi:hypothetical protein